MAVPQHGLARLCSRGVPVGRLFFHDESAIELGRHYLMGCQHTRERAHLLRGLTIMI